MYRADFNVLTGAIKLVENKVHRDFIEINNLQNSSLSLTFVNKTIEYLNTKFYNYFIEKRPNYSLYIKNYKNNLVDNSKYKIIINSISGIKNFLHAIPYFCTTISVVEDGKTVVTLANNYSTNEMFYVIKGQGSFLNNQKLRVSNKVDNILLAIKYDLDKKLFKNIIDKLPMFKINNCSILDCCNIATGKYDGGIFFDADIVDMQAGHLFIEEAGGLSKKINDNLYVFSNGVYMDNILKMIK